MILVYFSPSVRRWKDLSLNSAFSVLQEYSPPTLFSSGRSVETVSEEYLGRWGRRSSRTERYPRDGITFLPTPSSPLLESKRNASLQLQSDLGLLGPCTSPWPSYSSPGLPDGTGSNPYPMPPVGKDITLSLSWVQKRKGFLTLYLSQFPLIHLCLPRAGLVDPSPSSPQPPF